MEVKKATAKAATVKIAVVQAAAAATVKATAAITAVADSEEEREATNRLRLPQASTIDDTYATDGHATPL